MNPLELSRNQSWNYCTFLISTATRSELSIVYYYYCYRHAVAFTKNRQHRLVPESSVPPELGRTGEELCYKTNFFVQWVSFDFFLNCRDRSLWREVPSKNSETPSFWLYHFSFRGASCRHTLENQHIAKTASWGNTAEWSWNRVWSRHRPRKWTATRCVAPMRFHRWF